MTADRSGSEKEPSLKFGCWTLVCSILDDESKLGRFEVRSVQVGPAPAQISVFLGSFHHYFGEP